MRLVTRAEWGARPPANVTRAPGMTRGLGVHYLGGGRGPTGGLAASMATMREIQNFHMGPDRGWADFAYNAAVDFEGTVFEGRGPRVRNAANGGGLRDGYDANAGWASIVYLCGTDGPVLTDAARDGINDAAVWLGVAAGEWLGHRDFLSTDCPGDALYRWAHGGHARSTTAPAPTPAPPPDLEVPELFVFDHRTGVYYTDGFTKWGLASERQLAFFATGKVPHLGTKDDAFFNELRWRDDGTPSNPGVGLTAADIAPHATIAGPLEAAMERSSFETGDPGCALPEH